MAVLGSITEDTELDEILKSKDVVAEIQTMYPQMEKTVEPNWRAVQEHMQGGKGLSEANRVMGDAVFKSEADLILKNFNDFFEKLYNASMQVVDKAIARERDELTELLEALERKIKEIKEELELREEEKRKLERYIREQERGIAQAQAHAAATGQNVDTSSAEANLRQLQESLRKVEERIEELKLELKKYEEKQVKAQERMESIPEGADISQNLLYQGGSTGSRAKKIIAELNAMEDSPIAMTKADKQEFEKELRALEKEARDSGNTELAEAIRDKDVEKINAALVGLTTASIAEEGSKASTAEPTLESLESQKKEIEAGYAAAPDDSIKKQDYQDQLNEVNRRIEALRNGNTSAAIGTDAGNNTPVVPKTVANNMEDMVAAMKNREKIIEMPEGSRLFYDKVGSNVTVVSGKENGTRLQYFNAGDEVTLQDGAKQTAWYNGYYQINDDNQIVSLNNSINPDKFVEGRTRVVNDKINEASYENFEYWNAGGNDSFYATPTPADAIAKNNE